MKTIGRAALAVVPVCALVGAAAAPAHAGIILGENLVSNPGAESGAGGTGQLLPVPAWSVTQGLLTSAAYGAAASLLGPGDPGPVMRGSNYFTGGPSAVSIGEQRTNLFPVSAGIDSGTYGYELSAWLGTTPGEDDLAEIRVTFLDAAMAVLGTASISSGAVVRGDSPAGGLVFMEDSGFIPVGTREAVIEMIFTRVGDTGFNDGAADEVSFAVVPSPGAALLFGLAGVTAMRRRRG